MSNLENNRPDGIVPIHVAFDLLGKRLLPKRWSARHAHAALPGRRRQFHNDRKLHAEAWRVLLALAQHARDGDLPVVSADAERPIPIFHASEISMLYPLPYVGKPGQVELSGGDLFEANVDVSGFHAVLRRSYPRKKPVGRGLAHPEYYQAAIRFWQANSGKPMPWQVRSQIHMVNPGVEALVPLPTQYRYIENARRQVRRID